MRLMWVVMNRLTWVEMHSEIAMHSETDVGRDE